MKRLISIVLIITHCSLLFGQVEKNTIKLKKGNEFLVEVTGSKLIIHLKDTKSKPISIPTYKWSISHKDKEIVYSSFFKKVKIPFNNIKSIEYGIGNKGMQYGLAGGLANMILFNYLGIFDDRSGSNSGQGGTQKWHLPLPLVILGGIALLSPTLFATSIGLGTPKYYSEPMIIGSDEWKIVK